MKITSEKIEINPEEIILWENVKMMRILNEKLILVLKDNRSIELPNILPSTIDVAFRAYEKFLMEHPEKIKHTKRV